MRKKISIILVILLLIISYTVYKTKKNTVVLNDSVQSLTSFNYKEVENSIDNINADLSVNEKTISKENLNDIHNLLTFIQLNYKNLSTISSKATEVISSEHIDNLVSNVDSILEDNIDREYISLDEEGLAIINTVLDLYNTFTSTFDTSKIEDFFSEDKIKNIFDLIKEKL